MIKKQFIKNLSDDNSGNIESESDVIKKTELKLAEILPLNLLSCLFKKETFLIGGAVRDVLFGKIPNDFDFMTRDSSNEVMSALEKKGFVKTVSKPIKEKEFIFKIDKNSQNQALQTGVLTFIFLNQEHQVAFIGDKTYEELKEGGDINLNSAAFNINTKSIIDKQVAESVVSKVLRFNNPSSVISDPEKLLSALKILSRFPDLKIPKETIDIIKSSIPVIVNYIVKNPEEKKRLPVLLGNVNSQYVINLFHEERLEYIFEGLNFRKKIMSIEPPYFSVIINMIPEELHAKLFLFMKDRFYKRSEESKFLNNNVNSLVYELDDNGDILSCCLMDGDRICNIAYLEEVKIIELLRSLIRNNYSIWTTVSVDSKSLIKMAEKAGLSVVDDENVLKNILLGHYPNKKFVIEKYGKGLAYRKENSNYLQVLVYA
jgi:hypothetical protein